MKRDFALILPNPTTAEHEVMAITIFDSPTEADMGARAIYGATAYAMESSMWDLKEPCIYKEGAFYNLKMKEMRDEKGELQFVRVEKRKPRGFPHRRSRLQSWQGKMPNSKQ